MNGAILLMDVDGFIMENCKSLPILDKILLSYTDLYVYHMTIKNFLTLSVQSSIFYLILDEILASFLLHSVVDFITHIYCISVIFATSVPRCIVYIVCVHSIPDYSLHFLHIFVSKFFFFFIFGNFVFCWSHFSGHTSSNMFSGFFSGADWILIFIFLIFKSLRL